MWVKNMKKNMKKNSFCFEFYVGWDDCICIPSIIKTVKCHYVGNGIYENSEYLFSVLDSGNYLRRESKISHVIDFFEIYYMYPEGMRPIRLATPQDVYWDEFEYWNS